MIKFDEEKLEEIRTALNENAGRVYLGCDSVKYKKHGKWIARFTTVLIIHINNCNGGKIFSFTDKEQDFDQKKDRPTLRLMGEVYRVVGLYTVLEDELIDREVEIHLDINTEKEHGSHSVMGQAFGYVRGITGIEPKLKPEAFGASYAADHYARGKA